MNMRLLNVDYVIDLTPRIFYNTEFYAKNIVKLSNPSITEYKNLSEIK